MDGMADPLGRLGAPVPSQRVTPEKSFVEPIEQERRDSNNDQAIEIIGLWMAVYLAINLLISSLMNLINSRIQLKEG